MTIARLATALILLVVVQGCATLPRGSALQSEVTRAGNSETAAFAVYPVTQAQLASIGNWPSPDDRSQHWPPHSHGRVALPIAAGDLMDVVIWDSEENALLASPGQKAVSLQQIRVGADGTVFLPYIDRVSVGGLTADRARLRIQNKMESIVPSAQVQLNVTPGRGRSVDVASGVANPGVYPLQDGGAGILSVLSAAGGVASGVNNPQVQLIRGHQTYSVALAALYDDPKTDVRLRGGDVLVVRADARSFVSFGASGTETLHSFPKADLTAMEAVGLMGGLSETRANAQGVLILREYPVGAVSADGVVGPPKAQMVFTLDLTSADGLFAAKKFPIQSDDLVYVSESPITSAQTIFGLIGSVFGITRSAQSL